MSATITAPHRHAATPSASPWTGTGHLIRLALRRDRLRLSIWVAALTLMMAYAPGAVRLAYPEEAQRQARVDLLKTPAGMMLGGPMFGGNETELGAMIANELMLTLIVATSSGSSATSAGAHVRSACATPRTAGSIRNRDSSEVATAVEVLLDLRRCPGTPVLRG